MTARLDQGNILAAITSNPPPRLDQGALVVAVQFLPPNSPAQIEQGVLVIAARLYPIQRYIEINPTVALPCVASGKSVPHFWREA